MGPIHTLRWGPLIAQWLDDELDSTSADLVLTHLTECDDCLDEVETLACLKRSLARLDSR